MRLDDEKISRRWSRRLDDSISTKLKVRSRHYPSLQHTSFSLARPLPPPLLPSPSAMAAWLIALVHAVAAAPDFTSCSPSCTPEVLSTPTNGGATCGGRMQWLMANPPKEDTPENKNEACNRVGGEFSLQCGACKTPEPPMPPSPPGLPAGESWWSIWGSDAASAATALVGAMDRTQKLVFIEGAPESWIAYDVAPGYYVGTVRGIESLGIPPMLFSDAHSGFRTLDQRTVGKVTMWPSLGALSATWNAQLSGQMGAAIGLEFRKKGANGLLVRSNTLNETHTAPYTSNPKSTENLPNRALIPIQPCPSANSLPQSFFSKAARGATQPSIISLHMYDAFL